MNKLKIRAQTAILLGILLLISFAVPGLAAAAKPAASAATTDEPAAVSEPVVAGAPTGQQHFFVGLQPQHKLYVQSYLIDALHFAHNSYGFVAWSMRSARRNLQETLFEVHLKQLDHFITQTIGMADLSIRLTPDSDGLPEIKVQLEELGRAVKLMIEDSKVLTEATEPGAKVVESGKIHEQVGKALPALVEKLQKALQEHASATARINSGG